LSKKEHEVLKGQLTASSKISNPKNHNNLLFYIDKNLQTSLKIKIFGNKKSPKNFTVLRALILS